VTLYKNRKDKAGAKHAPSSKSTRLHEDAITHEVVEILWRFREQLGRSRTQRQITVDKLMRLVTPKFAYNNLGSDQYPIPYHHDVKGQQPGLWPNLLREAVALLHGYYEAVREGQSGHFDVMRRRWQTILSTEIDNMVVRFDKTPHAVGYILLTPYEIAQGK
jgi:hypothetical protein